jgi:hypothetical protein
MAPLPGRLVLVVAAATVAFAFVTDRGKRPIRSALQAH